MKTYLKKKNHAPKKFVIQLLVNLRGKEKNKIKHKDLVRT